MGGGALVQKGHWVVHGECDGSQPLGKRCDMRVPWLTFCDCDLDPDVEGLHYFFKPRDVETYGFAYRPSLPAYPRLSGVLYLRAIKVASEEELCDS